ncbi:semaphorin-5B-like [Limulus polyphemus]|uniref:Semaphorin-5B-like n=1 Tax=Limulus polyphemus TaxID=6850 RepID=A0ABM1TCM2_LIMPO|nr:semaphorin-5B-like [Limulus polyphemus]XP_022253626.1 semaphorin-5B-like [Limulus polyphemus]XP_022253627.1 semaphorin-5B-like [Limulus polyphemus]XP_022253628.1 semaphorin-5B-like [Limulus polyphemus]
MTMLSDAVLSDFYPPLRCGYRNILLLLLTLLALQSLGLSNRVSSSAEIQDFSLISYQELLQTNINRFSQVGVKRFSELLFDVSRYQLIVGARDYLFRFSLDKLKKIEEAHLPSLESRIRECLLKGQSVEDCRNFIKVLLSYNDKIFVCGTNAFSPECYWRDIQSLSSVYEKVPGIAKCPHNPNDNISALLTMDGDYYIASALDFSSRDSAIYRAMGKVPYIRTVQYDGKWLSEPNFVASYEIGSFVYFFFRESAVEYMNCGKKIYSRVGRVCKNDRGGQFMLKDNWTTFLKARLNCSVPGKYPFYFDELKSLHYVESNRLFYGIFTTPEIGIYGSAVCVFNLTDIERAFEGPFKYQETPKSQWERHNGPHKHFRCETPGSSQHLVDADRFKLMDDAVQASYSRPVYMAEFERFSKVVVDVVPTKFSEGIHVLFVVTLEGIIKKLILVPKTNQACIIEVIHVFPPNSTEQIISMKLLTDTSSLYVGTETELMSIPLHRCERFKDKNSCLNSMDPYCGWNRHELQCTTAPYRSPHSSFWEQSPTGCPNKVIPVHGGWSQWSSWFQCEQSGKGPSSDWCLCRDRTCTNPSPKNGGEQCSGRKIQVSNCTQNGQWTLWSAWSACSQSCGLALKTRRRYCGNPSPAHGGRICLGPEMEDTHCSTNPPCPGPSVPPVDGKWSKWSAWSECNVKCGGGYQVRHRKCNNPSPKNGGLECIGCATQKQECNLQKCDEIRKVSRWSPWLRLNNTKDGYFEQRFRFICRASVLSEDLIRIGHMKTEERFCLYDTQTCFDPAYINNDGDVAAWLEWSEWSSCSSSCGGGVQVRERNCSTPHPFRSGLNCEGDQRMERPCNVQDCKDGWKEWSVWSLCDPKNEQHRQRRCNGITPQSGHCMGRTKETRLCIPGQSGLQILQVTLKDSGISKAKVVGFCVGSFLTGVFAAFIVTYLIMRKRQCNGERLYSRKNENRNVYVPSENSSNSMEPGSLPEKICLRDCSVKRNSGLRTPIHADHNF